MKTTQKSLPKSQLEIDFDLDEQEFGKYIDEALLHLKEHIKKDGFRQGHVPKEMVQEIVGQENLLMEAGDIAVKKSYLKYVSDNSLEPIGEPEVQILKIAKDNNFLFKVTITVLPKITLPDYKEIISHIKSKEISVTETEIEDALNYLQKSRAKFSQQDKEAEKKDFVEIIYQAKGINDGKEVKDRFVLGDGGFMKGFEDNIIGMRAGQEREFLIKFPDSAPQKDLAGIDVNFKVKMVSVQKMELPEINDEFAKELGQSAIATREAGDPAVGFNSLVDLKNNIKEGLTAEKEESEKQRQRSQFLEKISEKIDFEMPEKLVEAEQQRLLEDLKSNIKSRFKISFEEYLASVKQTEEDIKKTFTKEAEKRIKNFLVLKEVGKKENIEISKEELNKELDKVIKNYSKEQISKIDTEQLKEYTESTVFNEKVFQKLESFTK